MPMTMERIAELLNALGMKFTHNREHDVIMTGFGTEVYRDRTGDQGTTIMISLHEGGQFLRLCAHYAFTVTDPGHMRPAQEACSAANLGFRIGRFILDPEDGEISLAADHAVLDSVMTESQLAGLLSLFPAVLDRFDELLRTAVETGEIIAPESPQDVMQEFRQFMRMRRAGRRMLARCSAGPGTYVQ